MSPEPKYPAPTPDLRKSYESGEIDLLYRRIDELEQFIDNIIGVIEKYAPRDREAEFLVELYKVKVKKQEVDNSGIKKQRTDDGYGLGT